ncbi:MAG: alpha/beta fold hydrolase [Candidatus Alcyoniella australis]|nr:alpha/beta fold hydrolase [Candidatus Alcyoniella australis]
MNRTPLAALILCLALALIGCKVEIGQGDAEWNDYVAPYRHQQQVGGHDLHYIDVGQGEPLIMVHGFADSGYCWNKNVRPLVESGRRVILIDQPGMGRSGVPGEEYVFSIENQSAAVIALADHLGLEHFDLIGSSMGGGITLYLALEFPQRVGRLAVSSPACFHEKGHVSLLFAPGFRTLTRVFADRWAIRRSLREVYFHDQSVTEALVDEYARPLNKPGYADALIGLMNDYFSEDYIRMTQRYADLDRPLLILWGEQDQWVPLEYGERLHGQVAGSRLEVIPEAGHLCHQELPEAVNPLLVEWFQ